ncbi:hypothetical protein [Dipodfec virus UOA04_Rod_690]|nr:hypothetical protein [Dipodfec virus UOA04_Rod_690]
MYTFIDSPFWNVLSGIEDFRDEYYENFGYLNCEQECYDKFFDEFVALLKLSRDFLRSYKTFSSDECVLKRDIYSVFRIFIRNQFDFLVCESLLAHQQEKWEEKLDARGYYMWRLCESLRLICHGFSYQYGCL